MVLCSASQESIGAAPSGSVTCAGTPTGSVLTYDNERRLATWQNTPSNPTSTAAYWYDGEGNRVAQTLNGVTTYYVGNDEEITGATLLKYYHIPGLPVLGTITGVTRTYLASDGLGSETVDLSYNGTVLATALYGPYGVGRYATGTMPTSRGYTGQRQDSGSGLDYYGARYYDALVGQFTSADTFQGPNRYVYVGGNPETATDPTGKMRCDDTGACGDNEALAPNSDGVHFVGPALDPSAFVGGAANFGWRAYRAEQAYWNIPTVFVNGYTRSNGTRVNDYWRRAPGDGARAADAGDTAAKWARAGRVIFWGAVATDFVTSGLQFYHSDPNDPDRVEKSIVAGGLHTVVTTTFAIGFAGLVTLIPGVGETGVAQLLAAGFGGWLGGKIADGVTNFANVTNITNTMNSWVSDASSLANNVGNKISDGVGTIVNAGGSVLNNIANVFSF